VCSADQDHARRHLSPSNMRVNKTMRTTVQCVNERRKIDRSSALNAIEYHGMRVNTRPHREQQNGARKCVCAVIEVDAYRVFDVNQVAVSSSATSSAMSATRCKKDHIDRISARKRVYATSGQCETSRVRAVNTSHHQQTSSRTGNEGDVHHVAQHTYAKMSSTTVSGCSVTA